MPLLRGGRGGSLRQGQFQPLPTVVPDPTGPSRVVTPVVASVAVGDLSGTASGSTVTGGSVSGSANRRGAATGSTATGGTTIGRASRSGSTTGSTSAGGSEVGRAGRRGSALGGTTSSGQVVGREEDYGSSSGTTLSSGQVSGVGVLVPAQGYWGSGSVAVPYAKGFTTGRTATRGLVRGSQGLSVGVKGITRTSGTTSGQQGLRGRVDGTTQIGGRVSTRSARARREELELLDLIA